MNESQAKAKIKKYVYQASTLLNIPIIWDTPNDRLTPGKPDIIIYTKNRPIFIEVKTNNKVYGFTGAQVGWAEMIKYIDNKVIGIEWRNNNNICIYDDITIDSYYSLKESELLEFFKKLLASYHSEDG